MLEYPIISPMEKAFILGGLEEDMRNDGRVRMQYRELEIQTGCIGSSMGSAKAQLGESEVMVTIMGEITAPDEQKPDEGFIDFYFDCSCEAKEDLTELRGESFQEEALHLLEGSFRSVSRSELVILSGVKVWRLSVDVLVLTAGSALFDTISFGLKAAFRTLRLPSVLTVDIDGKDIEVKLDDQGSNTWTPSFLDIPTIITLTKIGEHIVLDATIDEMKCHLFSFLVTMSPEGQLLQIDKDGAGCIHPKSLLTYFKDLKTIALETNRLLLKALAEEQKEITKLEENMQPTPGLYTYNLT